MAIRDNAQVNAARNLREKVEREIKVARNSGMYTAQGVREEMSETVDATNKELARLRETYEKSATDNAKSYESEALNLTAVRAAGAIEWRDAAFRAGELGSPAEASRLLTQAIERDDVTLVAEVVRKALKMHWDGTLDIYTEHYPDRAPALERFESSGSEPRMRQTAMTVVFRPIKL